MSHFLLKMTSPKSRRDGELRCTLARVRKRLDETGIHYARVRTLGGVAVAVVKCIADVARSQRGLDILYKRLIHCAILNPGILFF
jgi:hypothetical protein